MSWIRLEASSGLRIMAPSFNPPPALEGIDKMFSAPLHVRSLHCFRFCLNHMGSREEDDDGLDCSHQVVEEVLVLINRKSVGGKLGEVTIAVGSSMATKDELGVLLNSAFEAILLTNNSGARLILDALCASFSVPLIAANHVSEDDGLSPHFSQRGATKKSNLERYLDDPHDEKIEQLKSCVDDKDNMRRAISARRRALLYFVLQDIVPVSLLHCRISSTQESGCTPSIASSLKHRKALDPLAVSAKHACHCLISVIHRTLVEAFACPDGADRLLTAEAADKPPFFAAFSTRGLLFASPSFFRLMRYRDQFFVAAVAIDQLSRWPKEHCGATQLFHIRSLVFKCRKEEIVLNLIFIAVGNAVSCVFGFYSLNEGEFWSADTLRRFVCERLATPRMNLTLTDDGDFDANLCEEFAPHMLLCTASMEPTPWFSRFLRDMGRLEDAPRAVRLAAKGVVDTLPETEKAVGDRNSCRCFSVVMRPSRKSAARRFIWYTDAAELPLDVAWCVACSHVVKAEDGVFSTARDLGSAAHFTLLCSNEGDDDVRRYGVGWFQHCWRAAAPGNAIGNAEMDDSDNEMMMLLNPTRLLQGLGSIGGGPRPTVRYEATDGKCFAFMRKSKLEAQKDGDGPVFTTQMALVPRDLLVNYGVDNIEDKGGDDEESEGEHLEDDYDNAFDAMNAVEDGSGWMTAFYVVARQKVKDREAMRQEMVLLDGDQSSHEGDVLTVLQGQGTTHSVSFVDVIAACHNAANHVLEDVWRGANP